MNRVEKWIALTLAPNLGPRRIAAVYKETGGIEPFYTKDCALLSSLLNLKPHIIETMLKAIDPEQGKAIIAACEQKGIGAICPQSPDYPCLLKECYDPPPVLFYRGRLPRGELLGVVGSRKATNYGRRITRTLVPELCRGGFGIASGLAAGIDACAHRACLDAGAYTLAVLGNGLDIFYPYENRQLQKDILAEGGCLLSEFPPGTTPRPDHFPRRNRLISGLSRGVLVVEAGRKSGAMITVSLALEQGRDVFAVPGNIDSSQSAGANELIRLGAKPVTTAADILEEYNMDLPLQRAKEMPALSTEETTLLSLLDQQGMSLDELCSLLNVAGGPVLAQLVSLEIKGLVQRLPGQKFIRTNTGGAS